MGDDSSSQKVEHYLLFISEVSKVLFIMLYTKISGSQYLKDSVV